MDPAHRALEAVRARARPRAAADRARIAAVLGSATDAQLAAWARGLSACALTINFHPDRRTPGGGTVVESIIDAGAYLSQYVTAISNGSRSAIPGGARSGFERGIFGGVYDDDVPGEHRPVYATLDLLNDTRGGSPGFGSCHLVLRPDVVERCTLSVGDSHEAPTDIGTLDTPTAVIAGLVEQAAAGELLGRPLGVDTLLTVLDGARPPQRTDRLLDSYVEAQVHGGVDVARDVSGVVADPAFRDRPEGRHLAALAELAGCALRWHGGNELAAHDFPAGFRPSDLARLAAEIARPDGVVDAACIGDQAWTIVAGPPQPDGDHATHPLQQVKHLWQALVVFGTDASP